MTTLFAILKFAFPEPNILKHLSRNNKFNTFTNITHSIVNFQNRQLSMEGSSPGPVQVGIEKKLLGKFNPFHLEVTNESYKHSVPRGSESHFKVVVVSDSFQGKSPIQRHRIINELLHEELAGKIHALSIQAKTPEQWKASGYSVAQTPPCLGGSKADKK